MDGRIRSRLRRRDDVRADLPSACLWAPVADRRAPASHRAHPRQRHERLVGDSRRCRGLRQEGSTSVASSLVASAREPFERRSCLTGYNEDRSPDPKADATIHLGQEGHMFVTPRASAATAAATLIAILAVASPALGQERAFRSTPAAATVSASDDAGRLFEEGKLKDARAAYVRATNDARAN